MRKINIKNLKKGRIAIAILLVLLLVTAVINMLNPTSNKESETKPASNISNTRYEFNSQFEIYEGIQNGTKIKSLISVVMNSNKNNKDTLISYNDISTEEELAKTRINIIVNKNYKVKLKYNEDTGFIYKIIVDMENN